MMKYKEILVTKNENAVERRRPPGALFQPSGSKFLREPPVGPRSGGEAMSEAKPVRWRPRRGHALIFMSFQSPPTVTILYSVYLYTST